MAIVFISYPCNCVLRHRARSMILASDFPMLARELQRQSRSVDVMWCDYTSTMRYWFDNEPGNFTVQGWRADKEYMIGDVLQKLGSGGPGC